MVKKFRHKRPSKSKRNPRRLFTDCWNSFWHIIFGEDPVLLKEDATQLRKIYKKLRLAQ
jgi:hypothetical protein